MFARYFQKYVCFVLVAYCYSDVKYSNDEPTMCMCGGGGGCLRTRKFATVPEFEEKSFQKVPTLH